MNTQESGTMETTSPENDALPEATANTEAPSTSASATRALQSEHAATTSAQAATAAAIVSTTAAAAMEEPPTYSLSPTPPEQADLDLELDTQIEHFAVLRGRQTRSSSSDLSDDSIVRGFRNFANELAAPGTYMPIEDLMHDVPQQLSQSTSSSRRSSYQLPRRSPVDNPRRPPADNTRRPPADNTRRPPVDNPRRPPADNPNLRRSSQNSQFSFEPLHDFVAAVASDGTSYVDNSPVDLPFIEYAFALFSEDRTRPWYVSPRTVQLAIRQVLTNGRNSESGIAPLLNRATFMQRMRRVLFSMGHDAEPNEQDANDAHDADEDMMRADVDLTRFLINTGMDRVAEAARAADEARENAVLFDTELPSAHSYFGTNMDRVSGVSYLEAGQRYRILLFKHQHVLYPGEVLPFMISPLLLDADIDSQHGLLFGVCFTCMSNGVDQRSREAMRNNAGDFGVDEMEPTVYGVTCQIYEKGIDANGHGVIKSRVLQRFVTKNTEIDGSLQYIAGQPQLKRYGYVRILEEIFLPEPLRCINMGSMNRFRDSASMSQMYRRFQAASTPWPAHVYNGYNITKIMEQIRARLTEYKIKAMPTDPTQLSFWLVRNLPLSETMMKKIFMADSVNTRLKLIASTFKEDDIFTCHYCNNRIANCRELFAMSKHGVQTQYCNSAGYIHKTNTVYQLLRHAVSYSGPASAEFSWFPGYEWRIIVCKICNQHVGWEFVATRDNLVPRTFYGISSSSVNVSAASSLPANPRELIYRNFMAVTRGELQ